MSETAAERSREAFTLGHGDWARRWMGERTAGSHAGFFLPHLRRGMSLLDCGCGPGSITLDLAELVAPGEVVGIDLSARELATARALARARGVTNAAFQEADVYRLPFEDGCFDAVFAHSLLMHLRDPLGALREMRRVLRPGGVLGVRDPDYGAWLWTPKSRAVAEFSSLFLRVLIRNGGSPFYARDQRRLLSEAGFESSEATAQALGYGSSEATAVTARIMIEIAGSEEFREAARHEAPELACRLEELCEGLRAWAASPQAFYAMLFVSSVARKAGGETQAGQSPGGRT